MKSQTLLKDHETRYIRRQGNLPRHISGYKIRGTSAGVIRKGSDDIEPQNLDPYLVNPGFNSHGEHAWNGASEI